MKAVVYNLGCKVNKYECDCLAHMLAERGYEVSENLERADIYIINTCAVTGEAERKSRQCVARCRKFNKDAQIIIMGCASQNNPEPFAKLEQVTYVTGIAGKEKAPENLGCKEVKISPLPTIFDGPTHPKPSRTRAYVKVQDGCDRFCSYCLIPYLRGRSRSRPTAECAAECEWLAEHTGEIVLTGIDLSSYGKGMGGSLADLLCSLKDISCRIRLGSLEVGVISEEFLTACKGLKDFCPQFHLSLQSGSDEVLKAMNRHYTCEEYAAKVELIRRYFPRAGITTDLICGFPAEGEEEFERSLEFARRIRFSRMHIFGYSPRAGTVAAKRYKPLAPAVVKGRVARAEKVAAELASDYISSLCNQTLSVLFEEEDGEYAAGWSGEYIRCYCRDGKVNCEMSVRVCSPYKDGVLCEIIN